mgnify:CR=1 FL=1
MREKYESLSLATLKELAKARGLKGISTLRKPALIERMLQEDEKGAERYRSNFGNCTERRNPGRKERQAGGTSDSGASVQTEWTCSGIPGIL